MSKQNPLFVPRNGYGNFILSVFMTTVKMLVILILIIGFSATGLVMGIAKARRPTSIWIFSTRRRRRPSSTTSTAT